MKLRRLATAATVAVALVVVLPGAASADAGHNVLCNWNRDAGLSKVQVSCSTDWGMVSSPQPVVTDNLGRTYVFQSLSGTQNVRAWITRDGQDPTAITVSSNGHAGTITLGVKAADGTWPTYPASPPPPTTTTTTSSTTTTTTAPPTTTTTAAPTTTTTATNEVALITSAGGDAKDTLFAIAPGALVVAGGVWLLMRAWSYAKGLM